MKIDTKLYPTPQNAQQSNAPEVPMAWAMIYLKRLHDSIDPDERDSAVIRGWSGLSVHYLHELSDVEVIKRKMDALRQALESAPREGLSAEDVERLKAML